MLKKILLFIWIIFLLFVLIIVLIFSLIKVSNKNMFLKKSAISINQQLYQVQSQLKKMKDRDEYKINIDLKNEIKNIEIAYDHAVKTYESLIDLKNISKDTKKLDEKFAQSLYFLSKRNYSSASAVLTLLIKEIELEKNKITSSFKIPSNVKESNAPPVSGFSSQVVKTQIGDFLVYIVAADLNSTKVIVDTASDEDCKNDCPVMSLADYVSRSGAFAGINGSYFCPADYPSCADKKNSFDTLVMNKNKKYLNSDNNVYSTVPAVIFSGNSARFVSRSLEWGRDTGVDAVLAMQPILVLNGNIVFTGDGEPKRGSKGNRSFVGASSSTVYIGVVINSTVAEAAYVIHSLGIQNALNLDDGGSTALWYGSYKVGPGRNLPNALLFVNK